MNKSDVAVGQKYEDFHDVADWMYEHHRTPRMLYAKRLAGDETGVPGHMVGPRFPTTLLRRAFPALCDGSKRPSMELALTIHSHRFHKRGVREEWDYEDRLIFGGDGRKVVSRSGPVPYPAWVRLVDLGGESCPLLDDEATGSLMLASLGRVAVRGVVDCWVWLCRDRWEESDATAIIGPVEPGCPVIQW